MDGWYGSLLPWHLCPSKGTRPVEYDLCLGWVTVAGGRPRPSDWSHIKTSATVYWILVFFFLVKSISCSLISCQTCKPPSHMYASCSFQRANKCFKKRGSTFLSGGSEHLTSQALSDFSQRWIWTPNVPGTLWLLRSLELSTLPSVHGWHLQHLCYNLSELGESRRSSGGIPQTQCPPAGKGQSSGKLRCSS